VTMTITDEQIDVAARWLADRIRDSFAPHGFDEASLDDLHAYQVRYWKGRLSGERESCTPGLPGLYAVAVPFPGTPEPMAYLRPNGQVEGYLVRGPGRSDDGPVFTWPPPDHNDSKELEHMQF
jgi:hypothetical protein